ncbi:DUF4272 domain-containing protein [Leptospira sp. 2 VSF19]|uniref:DUF4272 domain-containing protein n=1 Tax=Leptospira soteropolitanensis TaxID=2950025 RepID=A0AAW5VLW9_9LEPT|nr:DUF4272 domain-containing protein [Leptospira soteropolitanensis]MCW7494762.1 DUF4272 domain-containing protein [Leptospira soteropolitanensis]MCW7502366.1 DUF4272 domain-containing protein [Leptospira soteropolitanensis]MCW7524592.1 DUF4272 domain-containing protein [Leptospira soteropolitanensis]MCW7528462.1 DUF4272 domain-containing protein [Leptospira soteropolitanensis]MCW7532332.1 DUF4272 domain-containing protein [Leptospira soteropolitanensis]
MKNPKPNEVIKRILALQLLSDRGWKEVDFQSDKISLKEKNDSIKIFNKLKKWATDEKITSYLTKNEYEKYNKDLGTLKIEEYAELTWQIEKLIPLLWAIGGINELPEFSMQCQKEYYDDLFFFKPEPIKLINKKYLTSEKNLIRSNNEIELYNDAYMLYNWRCKEILLGNKKRINIKAEIPKFFGNEISDAFNLLPLEKNGDIFVETLSLIITELNKTELSLVQKLVEYRQYAFIWLSGAEKDWELITTDT